ncbi:MAG: Ig-like domain-containing protein [Bacteroidota bacterium]
MKSKSFTNFSKLLYILLTGLIICFSAQRSKAQVCTGAPIFQFDFVTNPVSDTTFGNVQRGGTCCPSLAGADANCINLILRVGPNLAGAQIDIISGAGATGSFFASSDCGTPQQAAGQPFCLNNSPTNIDTVNVTFCKPGANLNVYRITTVNRPTFPRDTVALGCSDTMKVLGMTGVTWTSVFPGAVGQYNSLLSSTSVQQPVFTPTATTPALVRYRVCGTVTLSTCIGVNSICDTVNVTVTPRWSSVSDINICQPTTTASLGVAPLAATWTFLNGPATPTVNGSSGAVSNLTANGTYNFLLRRTRGDGICTDTVSVIRLAKPNAGIDQPFCAPATTGSAGSSGSDTWTFLSGAAPATIHPTTGAISGMTADGTYSFVLGSGTCSDTVVFTRKPQPANPSAGNNGPLCVGATLNLTATTVPTATYSWSGPAGFSSPVQNPSISNVTTANAGTYTVTAIINLCPSSGATTVVVINTIPAAPTVGSNTPVCQGGTINLSATGPGGSTYSWTGPSGYVSTQQNPSRSPATLAMAGSYCALDTVLGCVSAQACTNVVVNPKPVITSVNGTNPITCGGVSGSIEICGLVAGNSYTINYQLGGGAQAPVVDIADASGCVQITGLGIGIYSNFTVTLGLCVSDVFSGPNVTLGNPATPSIPGVSSNTPVCEGDTLKLFATGSGGATYSWTGPGGFVSSAQNPVRPNATLAMDDAAYFVTQTVAGCTSAPGSTSVVVNPKPVIGSAIGSNPTTCGGTNGTITLSGLSNNILYLVYYERNGSPVGPLPISSNGSGQVIITGLNSATYSDFQVEADVTGCVSIVFPGPVVLSDPSTPTDPVVSSNTPVCEGDTIRLFATGAGAASYTWTGPSGFNSSSEDPIRINATLAFAGDYCATQTVAGCTSLQACTNVVVNAKPIISGTSSSNPTTCSGFDGCVFLNGLNASTQYSLIYQKNNANVGPALFTTNGSGTLSICGLTAGTYDDFSVTLLGCQSAAFGGSVVLVDPTNPGAPTVGSNTPVCVGNTISLTASGLGGATYSWTGPLLYTSNSQNPSIPSATLGMAGSYCVTQTVSNCVSQQACTPVVVSPLPAASAGPDTNVCNGTSIVIGGNPTASGGTPGYTFVWSNGLLAAANPTVNNPTTSTIYTVTVTDSRGCSASSSALLTVNDRPTASAGPNQSVVSCDLTGITIGGAPTASGGLPGYTYLWSPTAGITPGAEVTPNPQVAAIGSNQTYTVLVTDANGCTANSSVFITAIAGSYSAVIIPNTSVSWCAEDAGADITLTALAINGSSPYTYSWTGEAFSDSLGSGVTAKPLLPGTYIYSVVITDVTGCQAGDTIEITVFPTPVADAGFIPDTVCSGSCVTLGGSPTASGGTSGYTYQWSGGVSQIANPVACPTISTTYLLTVTDANGCTATDNKLIEVYSLPTADAGPDVDLAGCSPIGVQIGGTPPAFGGGGAPFTYAWSPGTGLSSTTVGRPIVTGLVTDQVYTLVATDVNGCTASDQVEVSVINNSPSVSISPSGSTTWCANSGTSINLQAVVSAGTAPFTYSWSGSNITPTNSQIVAVNPQNAGSYNYIVAVTDATGCTATATIAVTVTSNPLANAGAPSTICAGACDTLGGAPTASSGTSPFTYLWSDGSTTANPIVCPTGTTIYRVTVTDDNGCTATAVTAITVRPNPVADAGVDKEIQSCLARAIPIGGLPTATGGCGGPYTYLWSPGGSTLANPTVLPAITTNYSVIITDACGCTATDQVLVTVVENSPTVSIASSNTPEWCAGSNGTTDLTANVTGGLPGYTFEWSGNPPSNPDNTQVVTANPNTAGTYVYTVIVTDASNCTVSASRTITVNPNPSANAGVNDSICSGGCVSIGGIPTASGGTAGYTYSWSNGGGAGSNPSVCPLASTTYVVTVIDSKSCSATSATTVIVYPNPVANAGADQTLINCNGDNVTIGGSPTGFGGSGSFSYSWSPSTGLSSTSTANPTVSGITTNTTYCVTVTDNTSGCTSTDCITITVINSSLQAQTAASVSYCFGAVPPVNIGGSPTASGGTPPYAFAWSGTPISSSSVPNPSAQPTATTTYCVIVTDANGCSASSCMTITVNPLPVANAGRDTAVCSALPVQIGGNPTGSGGTGILSYTWTPGTGLNSSSIANPISILSSTTSYCLTVSDVNGCSATDCMTVTINPNPVADAGQDVSVTSCGADSVLLGGSPSGSGGTSPLTYTWSPAAGLNNSNASNPYYFASSAGVYFDTLVVTDVNGCSATDIVRISVTNGNLTADAGNDASICLGTGDCVTLGGLDIVFGGTPTYTFSWTSDPPGFTSSAAHPVVCPIVTTSYFLLVTDANGCFDTDTMMIEVFPTPVNSAGNDTSVCAGVSVQIGSASTPGYIYEWSQLGGLSAYNISNPVAIPQVTTTYCVTVTDLNSCTAASCLTITVNPNPTVDAGPDKSLVSCAGDSVQIGGSPAATGGSIPYTYSWTPTTNLFTATDSNPWVKGLTSSQAYTLVVTDANGCTAGDVVQVAVSPSNLAANAGSGGSLCFGSGANITLGGIPTAVGGSPVYTYAWSSVPASAIASVANPLVSPTVTTSYCVTVTDSKGCTASSCATVTVNPLPVADAGRDTTICAGVAVTVGGANTGSGGTPGYGFNWSPGIGINSTSLANPIVTITTTSTYCVTVTDSRGCTASSCATITVRPNPVANAGTDKTMTACDNSCVQIGGSPTGSGGGGILTYLWSPPTGPVLNDSSLSNPFVCNLGADATYTVTVTDQFGCSATDEVFIDVTNSTLSVFAGNDVAFCQGSSVSVTLGSAAVGGAAPYTYVWSSTPPSIINNIATPVVSPTITTTYTVVVTDANGCVAQDQVTVTINPRPVIIPLRDLTICEGESAQLGNNPTAIGGTGNLTYSWSPGGGLSCSNCANPVANPLGTTSYCVTVTDSLGCSASACQTVTVNPKPNADAGPDRTIILCTGSCVGVGGSPTGSGGSNNFTYQWLPCLPVLSSCTTPNPIICGLDSTTTFTVIVTDNVTGCIDSDQVVVTVLVTTLSANAGNDTVYCLNNASCMRLGGGISDIIPTATGGTSPYTYQWGPGVLPPVQNPCVSPTVTTTYCVTVTDALGCSAIDCITITVDPFIIINEGPDTLVCNGSTITLGQTPLVSGGTGPFTYSWSAGTFPPDAENPSVTVTANTAYRVTVTDSLRCSATDQINVLIRPAPIADAGPDAILVACTGDSTVLGGSPTGTGTLGPYTYQWGLLPSPLNTQSNPVIGNLGQSQTYCVTVTDAFGCTAQDCAIITVVPNTLIVILDSIAPMCTSTLSCVTLGGSPTVFGGVGAFTYVWSGGPVTPPGVANPQACPLTTTTYTVIVTDSRNCSSSDAQTVRINPSPVASFTGLNPQYCVTDPNVPLTGSPANGQFSLDGGPIGTIFSPSNAGLGQHTVRYIVCVANCCDTAEQTVMVNPIPQVSVTGYQPSYCSYEPSVTLIGVPSGGTFTSPSPGLTGNVFNPSTATAGNNVITYTYTDSLTGCTNSTTITIIVRPEPSITVNVSSDTVCVGQSVTFTPNYGTDVTNIQYSVCGGNIFASGLNPVTFIPTGVDYCVRVRAVSSNGCIKDTTIFTHVNQPPVAVTDSVATCEDTALFIAVLDNDTDPENDALFVACDTSVEGSTTVLNNIITYTPAPDFNGVDTIRYCVCNVLCPTQCDTGLVIVSVCPINDPPVAQDIAASTCRDSSVVVTMNNTDVDLGDILTATDLACATLNGTITNFSVSGFTFTPTAGFVGTQTICVQVCDTSNTCDTATITITVQPCNNAPVAVDDADFADLCDYDTLNINVLDNDTDIDNDVLTLDAIITQPATGQGTASISGNVVTYSPGTVTGLVSFTYRVCDDGDPVLCDTGTVTITVIDCIMEISTVSDTVCIGVQSNTCLAGNVQSTYPWTITSICQPQNGIAVVSADPTCFNYTPTQGFVGNDTFCVTVCDDRGHCDDTTIVITILDCLVQAVNEPCDLTETPMNTPVIVDVLGNDIIPAGGDTTVTIACDVENGTVIVNSDNTLTVTPTAGFEGEITFCYQVCVITGSNIVCDSASVCVTVIDTNCYIPNGFSPNGDGVNDEFKIPCNDEYENATLRIYNRWGVEVWHSNGHYLDDFKGFNMQGTELPDGTYYLIYEYNDAAGNKEAKFLVIHR